MKHIRNAIRTIAIISSILFGINTAIVIAGVKYEYVGNKFGSLVSAGINNYLIIMKIIHILLSRS